MQGDGRVQVAGRPVGAGQEAAGRQGVRGVRALQPLVGVGVPAGGRYRLLMVAVALQEPGRGGQDGGGFGGVLARADVVGQS